jgi:nitronate monooxygenase
MPTGTTQPLTSLLGIAHPIVQAPMAGVQSSKLAIAVSNAGGLGSLPCAMLSDEALIGELNLLSSYTSKPYNLNFFCHSSPQRDPIVDAAWRQLLSPYYDEFGLDLSNIKEGPARKPFTSGTADLIEKFAPPVVSFHFGLPKADLLKRVKSWGSKILASATTADEALWLQAHGADVIIAQGLEAGGHRGMFLSSDISKQLPLRELLAAIQPLIDVPIIAAGGIGCAADIAEMMALGADGVQLGTAFLLCPEADTSTVHRRALSNPQSATTTVTNIFSGRPARGIINRLINELGPINPLAPTFPLASTAIGPLRNHAEKLASGDFSPLWAGSNYHHCRNIPAAELLAELATGLARND